MFKVIALLFGLCVANSSIASNFYGYDFAIVVGSVFNSDDYITYHPDLPLNNFVNGKDLGVIKPDLGLSYLLIVYRYLNNQPLNKSEQEAGLWVFCNYIMANDPLHQYCDQGYLSKAKKLSLIRPRNFLEKLTLNDIDKQTKLVMANNKPYFDWRSARLNALGMATTLPKPPASELLRDNSTQGELYNAIERFYSNLASEEDNIYEMNVESGFNYLTFATERLNLINAALNKQNDSMSQRWYDAIKSKLGISNHNKNVYNYLSIWIKSQQQLFNRNKQSGENARMLLAKLPNNLPAMVNDDVQYSIAASYLYNEDVVGPKQAAQIFLKLAVNKNYLWHEWAKYLQFRALYIAANNICFSYYDYSSTSDCSTNPNRLLLLNQAYKGMLALSKDTTDNGVKTAAKNFSNLIGYRVPTIAQNLLDGLLQKNLVNLDVKSMTDMRWLINNGMQPSANNEFGLWLLDTLKIRELTNQSSLSNSYHHVFTDAYTNWQKNPQHLAWLWLAVTTMKAGNLIQQENLIKAILSIPSNSASFVPLRITLLSEFNIIKNSKILEKQLPIIDATLAVLTPGGEFSATNYLLNQRSGLSKSFSDFVQHAFFYPRRDLVCSGKLPCNDNIAESAKLNYIVDNAADIVSVLPISMLLQLAAMKQLPDNYRPAIYANIWVRSIVLNKPDIEKIVGIQAMRFNPILTETITKINNTTDVDEKKTLFLSTLLHYPNLSPQINLKLYETWDFNNYRHYLTLNGGNPVILTQESLSTVRNSWLWGNINYAISTQPAFLTPEQQLEQLQELKDLNSLASADKYICDSLVELANRHSTDTRYAELLALAIQYTQFTGRPSSGVSKNAFRTLKKLYPNTIWANKIKYYY